tara:strand:+ start:110 stop:499 length:390 start_codon:yes stop_codon:yes gene_type:complete
MKITSNLISLCIVFVLFFSYKLSPTKALGDVDWLLLKENQDGKEWLDLGSLRKINDEEIKVLTKFFENPTKKNTEGKTSLYVMKINCNSNQFKDTSINGFPALNSKWQDANNDELIEVVIEKACKEEGF